MPEDIEAQTHLCMQNLGHVLASQGATFADVVSTRVFLTHFEEDFARMNAVYAGFFPAHPKPPRTCVGVSAIADGMRVEIDMIARRRASLESAST